MSQPGLSFWLPPSLGPEQAHERAARLEAYLSATLNIAVQIGVAPTYSALTRALLSGAIDAAWAPPFACARMEAMGVRVLVRGVRRGASSYRAAIITKLQDPRTVETLAGLRAVWSDRESVGGYLLAMAYLKSKGIDPSRAFVSQTFAGSYREAVDSVLRGEADVTSVFAPPARTAPLEAPVGLDELTPSFSSRFHVVAFTEEAPNDGVAVSMLAKPALVSSLEQVLLRLHATEAGLTVLRDTFDAERFEPAPRMGYRVLYRVALAGL